MLNIHTLSQGCIQTNSNFSDCQWNALAEQWLNSPTKKNLLSNLKRHSASLLGAPNNNLKSACIVAFINNSHIYYWHCHSLCLGEDVFVFLTPNHLLNFAFGAPLAKQQTLQQSSTLGLAIANCDGHILESNNYFDALCNGLNAVPSQPLMPLIMGGENGWHTLLESPKNTQPPTLNHLTKPCILHISTLALSGALDVNAAHNTAALASLKASQALYAITLSAQVLAAHTAVPFKNTVNELALAKHQAE